MLKTKDTVLDIDNIVKEFPVGKNGKMTACNKVSLCFEKGKTLGIIGESGCGKSTLMKIVMQLEKPTSGKILYHGEDITKLKGEKLRQHRRNIQMVFQDPTTAFNPKMKVKDIICEPLLNFGLIKKGEKEEVAKKYLEMVELPAEFMDRYPHNMSGGQRQRIGIARALAVQPKFIIADEPISALDVSIQAQVVNLLKDLQEEKGLTYLFIAHDLSMVKFISDRIGVMHYGRLLEVGPADDVYDKPLHDYTKSLISAVPIPDPEIERQRHRIDYDPSIEDDDGDKVRSLHEITPGHFVRCTDDEVEMYKKKAAEYEK